MSSWIRVEREARRWHDRAGVSLSRARTTGACASLKGDAWSLLNAATAHAGVGLLKLQHGNSLLEGSIAQFDPEARCILYDERRGKVASALNVAHELGHIALDGLDGSTRCLPEDIDLERAAEPGTSGVDRVAGYGPAELRERRANVFAREFLLPLSEARRLYTEGNTAVAIAAERGLPESLVRQQLLTALLAPDLNAPEEAADTSAPVPLDASQRAAAEVGHGPLLVEAGPGAGKTRTLTARIAHLLEQGDETGRRVAPEEILALTFSNRAAEELRERIARIAPAAANSIWIGTFHAFALDLLRRHHHEAGLSPRFPVFDPAQSLALVEDGLAELRLVEYRNLRAPARPLRDILNAISRAQDEDIGPDRYRELAEAMRADAETTPDLDAAAREQRFVAARKALEVARVYAWYVRALKREGALDFGGLICRAIAVLREHADVRRELQHEYRHILVDEYQDVNRASGLLLRLVAGAGRGLWVVGDPRQAIYRFRGASPANVALFADDFPGARTAPLRRNYRSRPAIVQAVAGFATTMPDLPGAPFSGWEADRAPGGEGVTRIDAPDRPAEGASLAREIERLRLAGVPLRDQAVLCRDHAALARAGAALEAAGVPSLFLGNLFTRPEVREMLALLQLLSGDGRALVLLARLPDYNVPLADALSLIRAAKSARRPFPAALTLADDLAHLSAAGRAGLTRLRDHLRGLSELDPAEMLEQYLLARSNYLRPLLSDARFAPQRRLALYQLVQFAREQVRAARAARLTATELLRRIRRLAEFGDERELRQLPERAAGVDGVRLLTVHASKGLEFAAVHLTELATSYFPASWRARACPPPPAMLTDGADAKAEHQAEEECLFFVALSRARDTLILSRAQRVKQATRRPSSFLDRLAPYIEARRIAPSVTVPPARTRASSADAVYRAADLDLYLHCPRQYKYERVMLLDESREENAYFRFHRVTRGIVQRVLRGGLHGREAALHALDELWQVRGPYDHAYSAVLFEAATQLVERAVAHAGSASAAPRREYRVRLPHGTVAFRPDSAEYRDGGIVLQRLHTSDPSKSELDKPIFALYAEAAAQEVLRTGKSAAVEVLYLTADGVRPAIQSDVKRQNRLDRYDAAMLSIAHREFAATTDKPSHCPTCPHYHYCAPEPDSIPDS